MKYIITFTDCDGESVVGTYPTLAEAQAFLVNVRYYPEYRRTEERLEIDRDGMSGSGRDESGNFTYNIKVA